MSLLSRVSFSGLYSNVHLLLCRYFVLPLFLPITEIKREEESVHVCDLVGFTEWCKLESSYLNLFNVIEECMQCVWRKKSCKGRLNSVTDFYVM